MMAASDAEMTEESTHRSTCAPMDGSVHLEGSLSSRTLCRILPFHLIVDRCMNVVQCGNAITKCIWSNRGQQSDQQSKLTDMFRILQPKLDAPVTYDQFLAPNEGSFVLELIPEFTEACTRNTEHPDAGENATSGGKDWSNLILDGRVVHLEEPDLLLFLCTPRISNIDELERTGLTLTEIPGHDPTRDIIIWNELLRRERCETGELAEEAEELQRQLEELELEKGLSDRLLYSILPPPVADQLRCGASVEAAKFDCASILFSGISEFGGFCLSCQPIDVVHLLNDLYSQFDSLAEQPNRKVYKVRSCSSISDSSCNRSSGSVIRGSRGNNSKSSSNNNISNGSSSCSNSNNTSNNNDHHHSLAVMMMFCNHGD